MKLDTIEPYKKALDHWLPGARVDKPATAQRGPDAFLRWKHGAKTVRYLIELKRNLATQDVRLVAAQLEQWLTIAGGRAKPRGLLLAPYVRQQQAIELRARGIDYLDLVGNAHIEAPGVLVHVEGKRPDKDTQPPQGRLTKGWVRTVMALLVQPELMTGPYRPIADAADVALGTVTNCMKDLAMRGFFKETRHERTFLNVPDLVALWVQTYGEVLRPRLHIRRFQMRETQMRARWEQLDRVLAAHDVPWTLTGADGAAAHKDFFRVAETEIYADPRQMETRDILKELIAQPAIHGGNLQVIEPPGPLATMMPRERVPHPPVAPLLLIYAELRLRNTGQANEAAEMVLPELLAHGKR